MHQTLKVVHGNVIEISFLDFEMESVGLGQCSHQLTIYDGATNEAQILFQGCGSVPPDNIVTSSNTAHIVYMISNYAFFGSKFKLRWTEEALRRRRIIPRNTTLCGENIILEQNGNKTFLTSPGYPQNYGNDLNCEWIIQTAGDMRIKMNIIKLELGDI